MKPISLWVTITFVSKLTKTFLSFSLLWINQNNLKQLKAISKAASFHCQHANSSLPSNKFAPTTPIQAQYRQHTTVAWPNYFLACGCRERKRETSSWWQDKQAPVHRLDYTYFCITELWCKLGVIPSSRLLNYLCTPEMIILCPKPKCFKSSLVRSASRGFTKQKGLARHGWEKRVT